MTIYPQTTEELYRLREGIRAALAVPFIDDLEDFIWEAIFAHVKQVPLLNPLATIRNKRLFDVLDPATGRGWSAKALRHNFRVQSEFELVIQRADIFKKSAALGGQTLSVSSSPDELGAALLRHWYDLKVYPDIAFQEVRDARICILLKSRDFTRFALYESPLAIYPAESLYWRWTDDTRTGLQGLRRADDFCVFRWYPNQKQFFERFIVPEQIPVIELNPQRLELGQTIQLLVQALDNPE